MSYAMPEFRRGFPKVFFGSGGGGNNDDSAMYAAQAQQAQAQLEQAREANQFAAQQALQQHQWSLDATNATNQQNATDKANAIAQFQSDLGTATAGARTYAQQQEGNLGISGNDYGLMNNFNNLLNSTLSGIGSQQTGNAGALVNGQSLYDAANSATLGQERNKLTQQYNSLFGNNYVNDTIGNDMLNSDEATALSTQQATAQAALDRAYARGTLNETGYDYANQQLGTQAAAAQAKIKAAGDSVLNNYRQQLTDTLSGAKTDLSNWTYGDNTDLSGLQSQIGNYVSQDKANASGDFQNAIAGQSYFDPTSLLSAAGTYQGTVGGTTGTTTGTTSGTAAGANTGFLSSNPLSTKPVTSGSLSNQGVV